MALGTDKRRLNPEFMGVILDYAILAKNILGRVTLYIQKLVEVTSMLCESPRIQNGLGTQGLKNH